MTHLIASVQKLHECHFFSTKLGAASMYVQVEMDNHSIYYGQLEVLGDIPPWIKTPTNEIHSEYAVIIVSDVQNEEIFHVHPHLEQIVPNQWGKFEKALSINRQSAGLHPKEVKILCGYYYTASEFKQYNGEDPNLRHDLQMYMTIKGTSTVLSAPIHRETFAESNIHPEVMNRLNGRPRHEPHCMSC